MPIEECWKTTGNGAISTKWIDINKGDDRQPNYRSRNVAREIAHKKQEGLFAATPPLEVMKLLLSTLTTANKGERLMVADVKRAYFHARSKRLTYVKLPPEDTLPGEENMCGRLNYSMHGTRDAAANWSEEYTEMLPSMGFTVGKATPCVFDHASRGLRAYVHGDDFVVVRQPSELKWMREKIEEKYELTVKTLGPDKDQATEVRVLNRVLRWTEGGVEYEVDPRHVEIILKELNIESCKPVSTPGTKDEGHAKEGDQAQSNVSEKLNAHKHVVYQARVARGNYLSPDRPDIAFAAKELARSMSSPTQGDWERLKRLARYLKGRPRVVSKFQWQRATGTLGIFTDADWAGDKRERKSTSVGCIMVGNHLLKGWAKTQTLIALGSGESELYATLRAASEGLGLIAIAKELSITMRGEVWSDASAALGIIERKGLGKTQHIGTGFLWIQQTAAERRLQFGKVLGRDNPADLFTKYFDWETMKRHSPKRSLDYTDGRASSAPELHVLRAMWDTNLIREDTAAQFSALSEATSEPLSGYVEDEMGLLHPIMSLTRASRAPPPEELGFCGPRYLEWPRSEWSPTATFCHVLKAVAKGSGKGGQRVQCTKSRFP